jgi:putative transcriptional regulator
MLPVTTINLQNQFLIAMPQLEDPNFNGTITYICQHNEDGAMGIIINRSSGINLGDIFEQLSFATDGQHNETPVSQGGPVQLDRGFVLHNDGSSWDSSYEVSTSIQLTTSRDILEAIANNEGPEKFVIALGYAGWGAGQLEGEIAQNSWLTCASSEDILFHTDLGQKYDMAMASIGLDAAKLSTNAGHA